MPDLGQQVNLFELDSLSVSCTLNLADVEDQLCMIKSLALHSTINLFTAREASDKLLAQSHAINVG
jgi:hypothetical protein